MRARLSGGVSAVMNATLRCSLTMMVLSLCGCNSPSQGIDGKSETSRPVTRVGFIAEPGCSDRAQVYVSLVGDSRDCLVRKAVDEPGRKMPCEEVGKHLRTALNLSKGAIVGLAIHDRPSLDSITALFGGLTAQGFESGGTQCYFSQ